VVTRTVTHVGEGPSNYRAILTSPKGVNVTVDPRTMSFSGKGEKRSFNVTIVSEMVTGTSGSMETRSGKLAWTDGKHSVVSPIVVVQQHLF